MKIAHVGNVASNAYLNAKRERAAGLESDCFDDGAGPAMWTPYWEDGDWDVPYYVDPTKAYDWRTIPMTNGYQRPLWAKSLGWVGGPPWFDALDDTYYAALDAVTAQAEKDGDDNPYRRWEAIRAIAAAYDLLVLYGPQAAYGPMLPECAQYVTLECSTMRSVPKRKDASAHFLAAAYQRSAANIITNADNWRAAGELGVRDRSRFIPHPIDLEKFGPQAIGSGAALREQLCSNLRVKVLFLAPARQQPADAWDGKGNHKIAAAFARYVHESEPQGAPKAGLILLQWGTNVAEMEAWLDALGITERVIWVRPAHKARVIPLYDACDLVLDQFCANVGSYGTTTVEALALGKPVITHIDNERHAWCEDIIPVPPHQQAITTQDIWEWMTTLAHSEQARRNAGAAGAAWAKEWCAPERLSALYSQLYDDVLNT